jgi:asparagine synthase (glutamine-hydrolysing)
MNLALAHRGPNDEGIFSEEGITLGHRRLSIIDLSSAGHQPMSFENGRYTIVYNGELYNFKEIKAELSDYNFKTATDTEVILAAFSKWGKDCLAKFNGMFAFAIWDKVQQQLFIARDRLGIKPLYYSEVNGNFIFSSEVRGILSSGKVDRKLNVNAIGDYLRYHTVHAPATIIENVKMLMPGNYLLLGKEKLEIQSWWKPKLAIDFGKEMKEVFDALGTFDVKKLLEQKSPYQKRCEEVRRLLRNAVECRLVADVPFGAFLSGGIDSSAIVALMSEVATSKVKTFSVVFDDSEFSEAVYARMVAKKFNTEHHEIKLKPEDFLADLPNALNAMDHPSGDGPNTYVVSKATKNAGITMALSGLGGDELFCGYDIFKRAVEIEKKRWLNNVPLGIRKMGGGAIKKIKGGVAGEKMAAVISQKKINFRSYYPLMRQVLSEDQVKLIFPNEANYISAVSNSIEKIQKDFPGKYSLMSCISVAEISTYMQNVLLRDTDQMSMAHALEVRVPFLDYKLVEYVLNLDDQYKNNFSPKKLLVDSLGDLLPTEIVNRPKMGFTFPWKNWMKNELKTFCEERLNKLGKRNSFDGNGVQQLWNSFLKDDPRVTWSRVWLLVVLSHWLEKNGIED